MGSLKLSGCLFIGSALLGIAGYIFMGSEEMQARLNAALGPQPECSWPSIQGTITGSDLANHVRANGEDDWKFSVRFEYEVGGTRYSSQQELRDFLVLPAQNVPKFEEVPYLFQACPDLPNVGEAVAQFRAAHDTSQFFPGRPVIVYYNPADKHEAVLAPGLVFGGPMSYAETLGIFVGCILPMVGVAVALMLTRGHK